MLFKGFKFLVVLTVSLFGMVCIFRFIREDSLAPIGIEGLYLDHRKAVYHVIKDSIFDILCDQDLVLTQDSLELSKFPWDTQRYLIDSVTCGNDKIEVCVELKDSTMEVLWFNAKPTSDDKEYKEKTVHYYKCFDELFKKERVLKIN